MPVFVERFLLPFLAAVGVALLITNPMNWSPRQRIGGGVIVLVVAVLAALWMHSLLQRRLNKPSRTTSPTAEVKDSVVTGSAIASGSNISQTVQTLHYHNAVPIAAPEDQIHYETRPTPKEIKDQISSLTPYMQHAACEHYVGLPVRWHTQLFSVTKIRTTLGVPDAPTSVIFCDVNIDDYPRLKVAEPNTPIEVSGFIRDVRMVGSAIELRDVKLVFLDNESVKSST